MTTSETLLLACCLPPNWKGEPSRHPVTETGMRWPRGSTPSVLISTIEIYLGSFQSHRKECTVSKLPLQKSLPGPPGHGLTGFLVRKNKATENGLFHLWEKQSVSLETKY